jgi:uncharacterized protein (TIRG00374 family)
MPGQVDLRVVGIVISAGCLVLAAYAVDWSRTIEALACADRKRIISALLLLLVTLYVFALRWQALISVKQPPQILRIFNFIMIGYFANAVLPARPGDLVRAVLLRQVSGISLSIGLASIVVERLFDISAICALGVAASFVSRLPPLLTAGLYSLSAVGLCLLLAVILVSWQRDFIGRLVDRFPVVTRHGRARFLAEWLERFASAVCLFRSPRRLAVCAVLTYFGWGALTVSTLMLIEAFQIKVPLSAAILVLVATNLGAVIPSSPGSLGVYHFMAVLALSVWGVDTSTAVAFAIASHALAIGIHIVLGMAGAWYEGVAMFGLSRTAQSEVIANPRRP